MKKNSLIVSIAALIIVLVLGGFLAYGYYQKATYKLQRPVVSMEIKDYGTIKIELYPDEAPNTVKNFIKLINEGYYNGLTFHRVEEALSLIQGGRVLTKNELGEEVEQTTKSINGEFSENEYENNLKFERGTLGLARQDYTYYSSIASEFIEMGYNSGYAQFFIMTDTEEGFDGYYTAFGKVVEGIEIVDQIKSLETKTEKDEETGEVIETAEPINQPVILNVTVDTFGVEYGEPITHDSIDINNYIMQKLTGGAY